MEGFRGKNEIEDAERVENIQNKTAQQALNRGYQGHYVQVLDLVRKGIQISV